MSHEQNEGKRSKEKQTKGQRHLETNYIILKKISEEIQKTLLPKTLLPAFCIKHEVLQTRLKVDGSSSDAL